MADLAAMSADSQQADTHQEAQIQGDIDNLSISQDASHGVDLVVALEACESTTDAAMALAVSRKAGFLVCPCCYLAHPSLFIEPLPASSDKTQQVGECSMSSGHNSCCNSASSGEGIIDGSSKKVGTDSSDSSDCSSVSSAEWLGLEPPVLTSLQCKAEQQLRSDTQENANPISTSALHARHILAALRAEAAQRHWMHAWGNNSSKPVDDAHYHHLDSKRRALYEERWQRRRRLPWRSWVWTSSEHQAAAFGCLLFEGPLHCWHARRSAP